MCTDNSVYGEIQKRIPPFLKCILMYLFYYISKHINNNVHVQAQVI